MLLVRVSLCRHGRWHLIDQGFTLPPPPHPCYVDYDQGFILPPPPHPRYVDYSGIVLIPITSAHSIKLSYLLCAACTPRRLDKSSLETSSLYVSSLQMWRSEGNSCLCPLSFCPVFFIPLSPPPPTQLCKAGYSPPFLVAVVCPPSAFYRPWPELRMSFDWLSVHGPQPAVWLPDVDTQETRIHVCRHTPTHACAHTHTHTHNKCTCINT